MTRVRTTQRHIELPTVGEDGRGYEAVTDSFPIIGSEGPVPEAWRYTTLGEVAEVKGGKRLPMGAKLIDERTDFPYIRVTDFSRFSVDTSSIRYLTPEVQKRIRNYIITKDDVFISIAGTIGRVGTIPDQLHGANLTENAARIVLRNGNIDKEFLKFCLAAPEVQSDILSRRSKNAQPKLALVHIKALRIPLPPLDEQKKIAHALSTVQRAIEAQERIIQTTTELKKALMHKLFTEGLHNEPQKQTEIGPVPESWEVVPLGDFLEMAQYGMSVKGNANGNYPILRMTNQVNGRIVPRDLQYAEISDTEFKRFRLERGDILFNRTNSFELVGRTAIFDLPGDFVFASYLIRLRTTTSNLSPEYINCYFNTEQAQTRLKSIATRAVSQSNISATRLKSFLVPVPRVEAQSKIVLLSDVLDRKISSADSKRVQLKTLFVALLQQLMSARIRVMNQMRG